MNICALSTTKFQTISLLGRWLIATFAAVSSLSALCAEPMPFTIYAPSRNGSELLVLKLTPKPEGKAPGMLAELKLESSHDLRFPARTIAQHPTEPVLYLSGSGKAGESKTNLAVRRLDPETNEIKWGVFGVFERDYSYMSVDRSGKYLLGCNYRDGIVDVYRLNKDQVPEAEPVATVSEGLKAAHCVLASPDNRHIYIPYVKDSNALLQYEFDEKSGALTALDPKNANPPAGTGPRHLACHPELPILYFSEEQGLGISVYQREPKSGQLTYSTTVRATGDDAPEKGVSASDIVMTPNAKFIYTGIRGHAHDYDFVAGYAIQKDGGLKPIGLTETSKIPWGLSVSPDGHYLVVTAYGGAEIIVYQIDQNDGTLIKAASLPIDEGISDVETR